LRQESKIGIKPLINNQASAASNNKLKAAAIGVLRLRLAVKRQWRYLTLSNAKSNIRLRRIQIGRLASGRLLNHKGQINKSQIDAVTWG